MLRFCYSWHDIAGQKWIHLVLAYSWLRSVTGSVWSDRNVSSFCLLCS